MDVVGTSSCRPHNKVHSFFAFAVVVVVAVVVPVVVVVGAVAVPEATFLGELSRRTGILDPVFRKGTDFRQFTGKLSISTSYFAFTQPPF